MAQGRRRPRGLRPEEKELWQKVAQTASPLTPADPKTPSQGPVAKPPAAPEGRARKPLPPFPDFTVGQSARPARMPHDLQDPLSRRLAAQPVRMDRKAFTRMKRGKLAVEARIDLHGMTLDQAHPRLVSFIMNAHASGKRLVLVITGKGRRSAESGPIPVPHGILKHQVPQWLRSGMLGHAVLQIAQAHQSHGGSGAFYVYLSRNR